MEKETTKKMLKGELVSVVAETLGTTKKDGEVFLDNFDLVIEALAEKLEVDQVVKIGNYMTMEKVHIKEHEARNPRTKETVIVSAHHEPKVKRTAALKNMFK
ncbi:MULTISPECIES: HU family DNA-binding protein [unclassified Clostridium]|uniref:HU family DNA-binding protein n=1 Tax=unclassified Clostridium TaxID=2614128 RepID=UPI0025C3A11E|nr:MULTISPECIES: HU family DNA-binding protein [unclassified Clostridium]